MEEYINVLKSLIHKGDRINSGLFSGDMGLCLVLYLLNKDVANHETEEIADALLEKVTESIATMNDTSFCNGLAGIGWAICLMHRKECIQGDINDILYNIDAAVYKSLCNPNISFGTDLANGLIGYMVYILFRLEGSGHNGQEVQALVNEATLWCNSSPAGKSAWFKMPRAGASTTCRRKYPGRVDGRKTVQRHDSGEYRAGR